MENKKQLYIEKLELLNFSSLIPKFNISFYG